MKVYFAAPLFDAMELKRNEEECRKLREAWFDVFLPQELGRNSDIPMSVLMKKQYLKAILP